MTNTAAKTIPQPSSRTNVRDLRFIHTDEDSSPSRVRNDGKRAPKDRLSAAIFYANELSNFRLRKKKAAHQKRWSVSARARKAFLIQIHRPWRYATGPITPAGKLRSSQNARIHDPREQELKNYLHAAMRDQSRFLAAVNNTSRLRLFAPENKDLENSLRKMGAHATAHLIMAFARLLQHDYLQGRESFTLRMLRTREDIDPSRRSLPPLDTRECHPYKRDISM